MSRRAVLAGLAAPSEGFRGAGRIGLRRRAAELPSIPEVKMAGFMDDAARAARWAAAHAAEYGADPNRLYLMGHSAGARPRTDARGHCNLPQAAVVILNMPWAFMLSKRKSN
jgi:hypothetical protein